MTAATTNGPTNLADHDCIFSVTILFYPSFVFHIFRKISGVWADG